MSYTSEMASELRPKKWTLEPEISSFDYNKNTFSGVMRVEVREEWIETGYGVSMCRQQR
jgi:hypothetical protein